MGRTADGQLWHTIRSPDMLAPAGKDWTPLSDVLAAAGLPTLKGHVVDVACARRIAGAAGVVEGLYVLVALDNEPPRLLLRSSTDGMWSLQPGASFPPARKVAAGTFATLDTPAYNEIHLAAVTDDGHLVSAFADTTGNQPVEQPDDVEDTAGETGDIRGVALASMVVLSNPPSVPLLAVTTDGRILQTRGHGAGVGDPSGAWAPWVEVLAGTVAQAVPADAIDAALAAESVVAASGDGHVWLAAALPNSISLSGWLDLETYTYTVSGPVWSGTFTGLANVGTFATASAAWTSEGLHVVGTTTDGRLWHQQRGLSTAFGDVELAGLGQDVGDFTAADCG